MFCLQDKMPPSFSVIVPIYNSENSIDRCVNSVLSQTNGDFELILVDDGSTDHSSKACDRYASVDSRVKVVHKENGGHTSARNAGLAVSRGRYVVFLDSDDWLSDKTVEICAKLSTDCAPSLIVFGYIEHGNKGDFAKPVGYPEGYYDVERINEVIKPSLLMDEDGRYFPRSLWGKAFERSLLVEHQMNISRNIRTGEDMCCVVATVISADSLCVTRECLYHYQLTPGSVSRSGDALALWRCQSLVQFLDKTIPESDPVYRSQLRRLVTLQIYSAAERTLRAKGLDQDFIRSFRQLAELPVCSDSLSNAVFSGSAWKQKIKAAIVKCELFWLMSIAIYAKRLMS